jgi:CubicO group peptidase (beta-lactamase class C family)
MPGRGLLESSGTGINTMVLKPFFYSLVMLIFATLPTLGQLRPGDPASVGMSPAGLDRVTALLESQVRLKGLGAASILVARHGTIVLHKGFGHLSFQAGSPAVEPDSVYIVASVTKPVTATALMMLVERGKVSLNEPVSTYLPEFTGGERSKVRVLDLLAHTSGLPDQLPENAELRRAHAPLSEFVKRTYTTPLLFTPGTAWHYQSMGILLAAEIVERISGIPLRDFERKEIFEPLGMEHSSLGLGRRRIGDTVQVQDPGNTEPLPTSPQDLASWGANSEYWRNMGSPWGGMHTTTRDLAILLQTFLDGGSYGGKHVVSPATVKAMTSDQNGNLNAPWGLGWRLGRSQGKDLGDLLSPSAFGHVGSAGTLAWADPETQLICVILTNHPLALDNGLLLRLVSNAVAASVEK